MVVRGMKALKPGVLQAPPAGYSSALGTFDSGEHSENMRWADFNGLMTGLTGFQSGWNPWGTMSRGETQRAVRAAARVRVWVTRPRQEGRRRGGRHRPAASRLRPACR